MSIKFDSSAIEKEERNFRQLSLTKDQRNIVEALAEGLIQKIEISKLAAMGFMWRAVREWQVTNSMTLAQLEVSPPKERMLAVRQMSEIVKGYLINVLRNSEDENTVRRAADSMVSFYISKFSMR